MASRKLLFTSLAATALAAQYTLSINDGEVSPEIAGFLLNDELTFQNLEDFGYTVNIYDYTDFSASDLPTPVHTTHVDASDESAAWTISTEGTFVIVAVPEPVVPASEPDHSHPTPHAGHPGTNQPTPPTGTVPPPFTHDHSGHPGTNPPTPPTGPVDHGHAGHPGTNPPSPPTPPTGPVPPPFTHHSGHPGTTPPQPPPLKVRAPGKGGKKDHTPRPVPNTPSPPVGPPAKGPSGRPGSDTEDFNDVALGVFTVVDPQCMAMRADGFTRTNLMSDDTFSNVISFGLGFGAMAAIAGVVTFFKGRFSSRAERERLVPSYSTI